MIKKYLKYNYLFKVAFTFYTILFSIVLLAGFISYERKKSDIYTVEIGKHYSRLNNIKSTSDNFIKEVRNNLLNLSFDPDIRSLMIKRTIGMEDYEAILRLQAKIANMKATYFFLDSLNIYFNYSKTIISDSIYSIDSYPDKEYIQKLFLDKKWLTMNEVRNIDDTNNENMKIFTITSFFPINYSDSLGAIISNTKKDTDVVLPVKSYLEEGIKLEIVDAKTILKIKEEENEQSKIEKLISYLNSLALISKNEVWGDNFFYKSTKNTNEIVMYSQSEHGEWFYVLNIPAGPVKSKSNLLLKEHIVTYAIFLCLFTLAFWMLFFLLTNPISRIISILKDNNQKKINGELISDYTIKSKKDIDNVVNNIKKVLQDKESMEKMLDSYMGVLKQEFLGNILLGKVSDEDFFVGKLKYFNINFSLNNFIIILLKIDSYKKSFTFEYQNLNLIKVSNIGWEIFKTNFTVEPVFVGQDQVAFVVNYTMQYEISIMEEIRQMSRKIRDLINSELGLSITLAIGNRYKSYMDIKYSYLEASEALKYRFLTGKNEIIHYDMIADNSDSMKNTFIASQAEDTLVECLKNQNKEVAKSVITDLKDMINKQKILPENGKAIVYELFAAVYKLLVNFKIPVKSVFDRNIYVIIDESETLDECLNNLDKIIELSIDQINSKKNDKDTQSVELIKEYIQKHYFEDITVEKIADLTYLSLSFVSKIFKENTGKTIIQFLTEIRLEHAKQLLRNTNISVDDIARKVGYNHVKSLIRFFKIYQGENPTEYRRQSGIKQLENMNEEQH